MASIRHNPLSIMALALLAGSMLNTKGSAANPYKFTNTATTLPLPVLRVRKLMSNAPAKNQRQKRKNARSAFAAGDRRAFCK